MKEKIIIDGSSFNVLSPQELATTNLTGLRRLLRFRVDLEQEFSTLGLKLLNACIYSSYQDCVQSGVEDEAKIAIEFRFPNFLDNLKLNQPNPEVAQNQTLETNG